VDACFRFRDLSSNQLSLISRKTFSGCPSLRNLQLESNHIACVDEAALRQLKNLEVITLSRNNLTRISRYEPPTFNAADFPAYGRLSDGCCATLRRVEPSRADSNRGCRSAVAVVVAVFPFSRFFLLPRFLLCFLHRRPLTRSGITSKQGFITRGGIKQQRG
jgi:hypothetical protein